jgi:hypothetical protein
MYLTITTLFQKKIKLRFPLLTKVSIAVFRVITGVQNGFLKSKKYKLFITYKDKLIIFNINLYS